MKKSLLKSLGVAALFCSTFTLPANAGDNHHRKHSFTDYARVVHVEPHYRIVTRRTPQRTCDSSHQHHQPQHS